MAHSDFSNFSSRADWQQELDTLVAAADAACQPTGNSAARQAAREDLRDFRNYPCPFSTMLGRALEALNDLSLADIGHAIGHLQNVQQQLLDDKQSQPPGNTAANQQPVHQARQALSALREVADQHPEVAAAAQQLEKALEKVK